MSLKVNGTTVINDSRELENIANLKTINGQSILGTGDMTLAGSSSFSTTQITIHDEYDPIKIGKAVHQNGPYSSSRNFCFGSGAMSINKTGRDNIAFGQVALSGSIDYKNPSDTSQKTYSNIKGNVGSYNIALGHNALTKNYSGENNVAIGHSAMFANISASYNIAIGNNAFGSSYGNYNIAIGDNTLRKNSGYAEYNIAFGNNALEFNVDGGSNIAIGSSALNHNTDGQNNIAIGHFSMSARAPGTLEPTGYAGCNNLGVGSNTLMRKINGGANVAIGGNSLQNLKNGNSNIGIGESHVSSTSAYHVTHSPVFNVIDENNRVVMGHTAVTNAYIQVPWTVVSDARDKTNFADIPHGLDFVKQLKPTAYQFRTSRESEETNGGVRYGFKAQDIAAIEPEAVIVDTTNSNKLYYNESNLIPILVKAIQELSAEVERLKNANSNT